MSRRGEIFRQVEMQRLPSNIFDMSYDNKLSLKMGYLVPTHIEECVPGDQFTMKPTPMLRMAPMLAPIMHRVDVFTELFFVPNRLVWPGWEDFITGNVPEADRPAFPVMKNFNWPVSSLGDYLGLPTGVILDEFSALPQACYQMVFNDCYRDQNLEPEVDYLLANGDNSANFANLNPLRKRAWQHDYFTSALPWAQKGDPVEIPLSGGIAPVGINTFSIPDQATNPTGGVSQVIGQPSGFPWTPGVIQEDLGSADAVPAGFFYADLGSATGGITVNELRNSIALQTWLETNARGGTRYFESMQAHFNVRSPDSRLQRPEYIGRVANPMTISEVLQTSSTDSETPQGNMSGHGISVGSGRRLSYYCQEHGYIIGIMSVMPKTAYQQGIPKHFLKFDPYQYYWKEFANIGEQPILNKELYYGNDSADDEVFGYTPRYAEYRYKDSRVAGEFRTSLNFWHMGRIFASRPALNASFISSDPTDRIFAVTDPGVDKVYAHVFWDIKARRPMPRFGVPSFTF